MRPVFRVVRSGLWPKPVFRSSPGRLLFVAGSLYTAPMPKMRPPVPSRPVFLDLRRIHFPVGAVASILHRLTGVLLILAVPGTLWLAEYSSRSAVHFRRVEGLLDHPAAAVVGAVVMAGLAHHLLAGVRLMLIDVGVGVALPAARRSAWGSLAAAAMVGLLTVVALWPETGAAYGH